MNERTNFSRNNNLAIVCFSSALGGLELSAIRLAREFNSRGANCILIVPPATPLAEQAAKYNLQAEYLRPALKYGDLLASWKLAGILSSYEIDIALIMQSRDINIVAAAKFACPSIRLVYYQQMQSRANKRDAIHSWMYSKLSLWISLTNQMKEDVLRYTRVTEEMIRVIPLGRDTGVFNPHLYDQRAVRAQFGLPIGRPIVATMGRLDPQKGQEQFLRSLPLVSQHFPDVLFVIAGDETKGEEGYRQQLIDLGGDLGVLDLVRFLPFTENVPAFMAAIDVFVLPSFSETFGLVLIEAMAMEKSVVATSAGGVPEIVEDGQEGLLIPPRDERALAEAILLLLKDHRLRVTLSHRARTHVIRRFEFKRCVDQLILSLDSL
jgi:D-inositol-3-phosphate glycosyltransferase